LPKKGDAKINDLQERRTPARYSTGNCISGPAVMDWNFKSGADYIRTERKRSSQSSVLEIYHKKPPPCDMSDDITIPLKNGRFRLNPFILQPVGVAGFSIDEFSLTISIDSQING
jgi:hypothetical protein